MSKYSQTYFITNDCMDKEYHLRPLSVIMFFQDCFAQYMTTKNVAAFDIIKDNIFWVVADFNIDFAENMPFWSEKINVNVWVSELTRMKMYVDFALFHNDEIFAKGNSCWYILDMNSRRPLPMNLISKSFDVENDFILGEHKKFVSNDFSEMVAEVSHVTNLSDIDFNNHVNNKSYLNLAQSTIGQNFRDKNFLKKLSVKFIKESFLYDKLICSTYKANNEKSFIHKIKKDDDIICEILTEWSEKTQNISIEDYKLQIR